MNYDEFFQEAEQSGMSLNFDNKGSHVSHKLSNEALFHLPLIAMTILLLSKSRKKPKCDELGQIIGECFERTFVGFKGSSQHLGWSANLRMRTVKALTFLEAGQLISVGMSDSRIKVSIKGKKVIEDALNRDGDLSYTLHLMERNYRNIEAEKQISMELV